MGNPGGRSNHVDYEGKQLYFYEQAKNAREGNLRGINPKKKQSVDKTRKKMIVESRKQGARKLQITIFSKRECVWEEEKDEKSEAKMLSRGCK